MIQVNKTDRLTKGAIKALLLVPFLFAIATGLGWLADIPAFKNPFPHQSPVAPTTAICFILTCVSILCLAYRDDKSRRAVILASSGLATLISLCVMAHYFFIGAFDIDQLFSRTALNPDNGYLPGRMSLMTAFALFALQIAIYRTAIYIDQVSVERDQLRDKALESARIKSEFLANMSHEIRTPMNAVIGSADMLARTNLNRDQRRFVEIITTSGNSLLHIINNILLLSKIEAGKHQRENSVFNLRGLIDSCTQLFESSLVTKKIAFSAEVAPELDALFEGEPESIRQILTNLIGNAIKFTGSGFVKLSAQVAESHDDRFVVNIVVTDSGVGISPEQLDILFQPFAQADGSITRKFGGTGLGLAISKRLVDLMNGTITVSSEPGQGSKFSVQLPMNKAASVKNTDSATSSPPAHLNEFASGLPHDANRQILLVEDTPVNQEIAKYQLRALGFNSVICSNGQEAVQAMAAHRFPLVLMDCQMPIMDGYEATRIIRERESMSGIHTPIIAMTANAMEGDADKCIAAGMDDYISKPVTVQALRAIVEKWFLVALDEEEDESRASILKPLHEMFGAEDATRFLNMFWSQAPEQVREMEGAIRARDSGRIADVAHSLRGSAAALGFEAIGDTLRLIEMNCADFIVCTNELARLRQQLSELKSKIAAIKDLDEVAEDTSLAKLFVVEDNDLTRNAIISLLSQSSDFAVVGDCSNGASSIDMILQTKPDVALFDIDLPGLNGNDAIAILKNKIPELKALMLTSHDSDEELFRSFSAGADGYITKGNFNRGQLALAIRTVLTGNCWLDPALARRVLQVAATTRPANANVLRLLSPADEDTLRRIAEQDHQQTCDGDVCSVEPAFLSRLKRLAQVTES